VWALERACFRLSGGRLSLSAAADDRIGTLRLRTLGRRSGHERATMLSYLEDGLNLAVVASNAGATWDPAWWLNLQTSPEAYVDLSDGSHPVEARAARRDEHDRLWTRFVALHHRYDDYAASADRPIPIVILEPSTAPTSRSGG
jgi:deazaflavin-dependent oxidoreductase (nitroreductase family)